MDFQVMTGVPTSLKPGAIERAIKQFVEDTASPKIPLEQVGLCNQMVSWVFGCLVTKTIPNSQVWIAEDSDGEVAGFALTSFEVHVDNKLTMWLSAAWVRKQHRFTRKPKEWFHQMEAFGKAGGAKHLLIPSVRGSKGYLRYIGKDWHQFEVILKKDL